MLLGNVVASTVAMVCAEVTSQVAACVDYRHASDE